MADSGSANGGSGQGGRKVFPLGTRKSKLAMVQTEQFQAALQSLYPEHDFPIVPISAMGDNIQSKPLHHFTAQQAKGLWTVELEQLLAERKCRISVHCLKDLPTELPRGFKVAVVGEREDPRDVVVMASHCVDQYASLAQLPAGSVVGTSSIRRAAQIRRSFPALAFADVRGNVGTRLAKLDDRANGYSCLILAAAGLIRLGLQHRITAFLEPPVMHHAPGQGVLAIEIVEGDDEVEELLQPLDDKPARMATWAERGMMRRLEGGCSVPIGAATHYDPQTRQLTCTGTVTSLDGTTHVETTLSAQVQTDKEAWQLGERVADKLVADGAKDVLRDIERTRQRGDEAIGGEVKEAMAIADVIRNGEAPVEAAP